MSPDDHAFLGQKVQAKWLTAWSKGNKEAMAGLIELSSWDYWVKC
jgi:hypothetical protein